MEDHKMKNQVEKSPKGLEKEKKQKGLRILLIAVLFFSAAGEQKSGGNQRKGGEGFDCFFHDAVN